MLSLVPRKERAGQCRAALPGRAGLAPVGLCCSAAECPQESTQVLSPSQAQSTGRGGRQTPSPPGCPWPLAPGQSSLGSQGALSREVLSERVVTIEGEMAFGS